MKNKRYGFGGIVFEIETEIPLRTIPKYEAFLTEADADYRIRILPMPEDSEYGRSVPAPVERNGNCITISANCRDIPNVAVGNVLCKAGAAYCFPEHDAFILHASYIVHNGHAMLFTAPSGTGKSTQATFWKEKRGAEIVNGDRVLVTKKDGMFFANGIYAAGSSEICKNVTAPIGSVILLEQGMQNAVREVMPRELFLRILCQCSFNMQSEEQYAKITSLVAAFINGVSVCCYGCRNHPDSVDALERILWNKM